MGAGFRSSRLPKLVKEEAYVGAQTRRWQRRIE
jgi:hypothetical protein